MCVNKKEAKQYFDENLTLEIKVIEKNKNDKIYDLVKLNMNSSNSKDEIKVLESNKKTRKLVKLSEKQIKEKKEYVILKENNKKKESKKNIFSRKKSKKNKTDVVRNAIDTNQAIDKNSNVKAA